MSQTVVLNTGEQIIINTDLSKIFLWNNRFDKGEIVNSSYNDAVYYAGTPMGRISATGKIVPFTSGASDGSQYIVGVLNEDHVVIGGDTKEVYFCVSGEVAEEKILLQGSDTLDTVVGGRQIRDKIGADTVGIKLVKGVDLTKFDNPTN